MVRLRLGRVYRFPGRELLWALSQFGPRTTFRFLAASADGTTRTEKEIAVEQLRASGLCPELLVCRRSYWNEAEGRADESLISSRLSSRV